MSAVEEVTTVAADFMYLVVLSDETTMKRINRALNIDSHSKQNKKLYVYIDIDTQIDYIPETPELQSILKKGVLNRHAEASDLNDSDHKDSFTAESAVLANSDSDDANSMDTDSDDANSMYTDSTYSNSTDDEDVPYSGKRYFVMGEGVETAQCYTCGEGYENMYMLIEIEDKDEYCTIGYPVLNLDKEVNPEDLIASWVMENGLSGVASNINIRLVNMVGTEHDILVFAAHINKEKTKKTKKTKKKG